MLVLKNVVIKWFNFFSVYDETIEAFHGNYYQQKLLIKRNSLLPLFQNQAARQQFSTKEKEKTSTKT